MPRQYTVEEVFEMAMQLERNGETFYTAAAKQTDHPDARRLMSELAEWERRHEKRFKQMAEAIPEDQRTRYADEECEAARYLDSLVAGKIFKMHGEAMDRLAGGADLPEVFDRAIGMEKESILFYLGIRDMVDKGRDKVEQIIREEMRHVRILTEQAPGGD